MMKQEDPFEKEPYVKKKLDEYYISIPDFPRKRSRFERFIHILASPSKNPFEPFVATANGMMLLKIVPPIAMAIIGIIQLLVFL